MAFHLYETEELLNQYLLFHYGSRDELMPWDFGPTEGFDFPVRCVSEGVDLERLPENSRALDVGCAVGRATFELARHCKEVIGIDYSDTFIMAARMLCRERVIPYEIIETGKLTRPAEARIPEVPCDGVLFEQGNAEYLRENLGAFDVVLAANLLCRLTNPRRFLERLPSLVNPGGQVIITTPNTWLEEFTDREFWLGGTPETGEPLDVMQVVLKDQFKLDHAWDIPFLIREHKRKFQWSVAQASRWIRQ